MRGPRNGHSIDERLRENDHSRSDHFYVKIMQVMQDMKDYFEMAGLVLGHLCRDHSVNDHYGKMIILQMVIILQTIIITEK